MKKTNKFNYKKHIFRIFLELVAHTTLFILAIKYIFNISYMDSIIYWTFYRALLNKLDDVLEHIDEKFRMKMILSNKIER